MNFKEILEQIKDFEENFHKCVRDSSLSDNERKKLRKEITIQYGELEEIIKQFVDIQEIVIPSRRTKKDLVFPNFIDASILTSLSHFPTEAHNQLLKLIGIVQQKVKEPNVPNSSPSISTLIQSLRRFRECCQYIEQIPKNEKAVQDIIWIMLRSQFDRIVREETLQKFGTKSYKPDFGIPDLQVLIEAKFIGEKTNISYIQEGILADVPGYLIDSNLYHTMIVFVYDSAHKLRDPRRFIEDISSVKGIGGVVVTPGFG